jgi:hypothetical protein
MLSELRIAFVTTVNGDLLRLTQSSVSRPQVPLLLLSTATCCI